MAIICEDELYVACQQRLSFGSSQEEFPLSKYVEVLEADVPPLNFDRYFQGEDTSLGYQTFNSMLEQYSAGLLDFIHTEAMLKTLQHRGEALADDASSIFDELDDLEIENILSTPSSDEIERLASLVSSVVDSYDQRQESEKLLLSRLETLKHKLCVASDHSLLSVSQLSDDDSPAHHGSFQTPLLHAPAVPQTPQAAEDDALAPLKAQIQEMQHWYQDMTLLHCILGGIQIHHSGPASLELQALSTSTRIRIQFSAEREIEAVSITPQSRALQEIADKFIALEPRNLAGLILTLRESDNSINQ